MVVEFTPISAALGGIIIGLAATLLLATEGRIAGISGILAGLFKGGSDKLGALPWQAFFVAGMVGGGILLRFLAPELVATDVQLSAAWLIPAGLIVGVGTRVGNGCTSGHGVCGLSRFSARSLVATLSFMAAAMITVFITRTLAVGAFG
ncbi:YeeE/YedE family protein [Bradymonadaceae bacterium TMQ3]|uniref:YeeE/YedE family protein n=1 Tax=Lujinxingia sediminis TaxID=2480984 RepID=A0ABY0CW71_9DELT|nr:YeeE/YedE thiosulfate transporter family protein [Lujinxingia sediminis]RDV37153.1 YeeE/YedE family protein [Bradymonadaceae bacterium TMQ3]RVU46899.1 YeeE/YedE family protein [Lujinxingia sediminis]TXC74906.1 YeeE/YedE family protein [Bradymonadales bacterium TMQ1]